MMERVKASAFTDAAAAEADKSRPNQCAAAQMGSLVAHVIGEGSGWSGASRLRYLHEFRFEPFNPAKPQGRGQAWVTLTDGCGVFMVVLVKDLGFVKTSTQRPQQTATKEFKRREKKRGAVAAVLRAAAAFESQCIHSSTSSSSPCAIVFAALCCSHAGRIVRYDCTVHHLHQLRRQIMFHAILQFHRDTLQNTGQAWITRFSLVCNRRGP
jgi:hypothetical protein